MVARKIDICHAVSSLSRFSAAPRKGHLQIAQRLLGYLKKHQRKDMLSILNRQQWIIDIKRLILRKNLGINMHISKKI